MCKVQVEVEDLEAAARKAVMSGYKRRDPNKPWNNLEQREAVRWYLEQQVRY